MKKQPRTDRKPLALATETVRQLDDLKLAEVNGAIMGPQSAYSYPVKICRTCY
jgi:hypothetical protein